MISTTNHTQGRPEASHGSRELEVTKLPALRGRDVREVVHSHCLGNAGAPQRCAAAARTGLVQTAGPVRLIPIARGVPAAQRSRVLPTGRRSAALPMRQRIATNSCRALKRRGSLEPLRIDPCACKPTDQSHRHVLSGVPGPNDRDRDRERFGYVGTAFQGSRNVFRG